MTQFLRKPLLAFGLLLAMISFTAIAPATVGAQNTLDVSGSVSGGGTFEGVVLDPEFVAFEEALEFRGQLEGVVTLEGTETEINVEFAAFANVSENSNCETVSYVISPIAIDEIGEEIQLDEISMERPATGLIGGLLGGGDSLFCAVDELLGGNGGAEDLADVLNDLLDELGY